MPHGRSVECRISVTNGLWYITTGADEGVKLIVKLFRNKEVQPKVECETKKKRIKRHLIAFNKSLSDFLKASSVN